MGDSLKTDDLFVYGKGKHVFWVGEVDESKVSDKHYPDQICHFPQLPRDLKEISLEEAVERDMVRPNRFNRMGDKDRENVISIMYLKKGNYLTDEFLDKTRLDEEGKKKYKDMCNK